MAEAGAAVTAAATPSRGWLAKERTVARAHFNRWLAVPAALATYLSIGVAYGFSVFWLPLSRAIGVQESISCGKVRGSWEAFVQQLVASHCDWKISSLSWVYALFFVFPGSAAAVWGGWLERAGPRKAGVVAASCWCGGLVLAAAGVAIHRLWLVWIGSGVIGGIGLGLGYIVPASTLTQWFPDHRGMATGMAIMGFGAGAVIGTPLADQLMRYFATPTSVGVWETFLALAAVCFLYMMAGAFGYRLPAADWQPPGGMPPAKNASSMITNEHVHLNRALRTPQFWLLWGALCLNASAGVGIMGMASPLLQEVFGGHLIGLNLRFDDLNAQQRQQIATLGAGFAALLSLCLVGGPFFWGRFSNRIGRRATYFAFFVLGAALYAAIPTLAHTQRLALCVLSFCIILSLYGAGFAALPAYLADMFGTQMVGAIHDRLLTAWSVAGLLGPLLVVCLRQSQIDEGVARALAYDEAMYLLAGMLLLGCVCNLLIRPVAGKYFMSTEQLVYERSLAHERLAETAVSAWKPSGTRAAPAGSQPLVLAAASMALGLPLAWGLWVTLQKAIVLLG